MEIISYVGSFIVLCIVVFVVVGARLAYAKYKLRSIWKQWIKEEEGEDNVHNG